MYIDSYKHNQISYDLLILKGCAAHPPKVLQDVCAPSHCPMPHPVQAVTITRDLFHHRSMAQKAIVDNLAQTPCARTSLLSGIAAGVGFGFIRGLAAGAMVGFHWTMGSFVAVSLGTWMICRGRIREEKERMNVWVDSLPKIRRRRPDELVDKDSSS